MSALYLYAVCPANLNISSMIGIREVKTKSLVQDGLQAIFSPCETQVFASFLTGAKPSGQNMGSLMLAHESVVAAAQKKGVAVPAPFGTVLSSEKSLRQMLSEQSDMWLSKLAQGEGCVEVSIKAFVKHDALLRAVMIDVDTRPLFLSGPLATEPRVTELEAQRDAHNRLSKVLGGLHRTCASLSREAVLKPMPLRDSGELGKLELRAVYLVKRSKFADIDAAVDAVNDTHGDWLTVIINGPHAPFNHLQRVDAFEM